MVAAPAVPSVPAVHERGRAWRPFRAQRLEKVSRRHLRLVRSLEDLLPGAQGVAAAVQQHLRDILEDDVSVEREFVHVVPQAKLQRYVSEPTFLAVLSLLPNKPRGFLELDLGLAHRAIDLLLGGAGEATALRPLTDIEEGMMTYLVIEILRTVSAGLDPALPKVRLESLARSFGEVSSVVAEDDSLVVAQLKVGLGSHAGYARWFIPEVLLAEGPGADSPSRRARRLTECQAGAWRLSHVAAELRVEIGQVAIGAGELAHLREGDVVLVDGLTCRPDRGQGGTARLKVGLGQVAFLDAEVTLVEGRLRAEVKALVWAPPSAPGAVPADERPVALGALLEESTAPDTKGGDDVDGHPEGADLINDLPLVLSVELARVPITGEAVAGLRVGQVFDLHRTAAEPLALSVNGRVMARGELVELDGNLGVRILSIAG